MTNRFRECWREAGAEQRLWRGEESSVAVSRMHLAPLQLAACWSLPSATQPLPIPHPHVTASPSMLDVALRRLKGFQTQIQLQGLGRRDAGAAARKEGGGLLDRVKDILRPSEGRDGGEWDCAGDAVRVGACPASRSKIPVLSSAAALPCFPSSRGTLAPHSPDHKGMGTRLPQTYLPMADPDDPAPPSPEPGPAPAAPNKLPKVWAKGLSAVRSKILPSSRGDSPAKGQPPGRGGGPSVDQGPHDALSGHPRSDSALEQGDWVRLGLAAFAIAAYVRSVLCPSLVTPPRVGPAGDGCGLYFRTPCHPMELQLGRRALPISKGPAPVCKELPPFTPQPLPLIYLQT